MNKIKFFVKNNKWWSLIILVIVIIFVFILVGGDKNGGMEFANISKGDIVKEVSISGKVKALENVELSFDVGGIVSSIQKKTGEKVSKGELLISLDSSKVLADLREAEANLASAQAELRSVEIGIGSSGEVENVKREAVNSIVKASNDAVGAVRINVDQFIDDPNTSTPEIEFAFDDFDLRNRINKERAELRWTLTEMDTFAQNISEETVSSDDLEIMRNYVSDVLSFLNLVVVAVSDFDATTGLTETQIDKYRTDTASARTSVVEALDDLTSSEDALRTVYTSGGTKAYKVAAEKAIVDTLKSDLSKMSIISPIDGIISDVLVDKGESVSSHEKVVSIISESKEVEVFIPELNIAGVSVGNKARITFDPYGKSVEIMATVIHIDPAETVKDGVSTYKVRMAFDANDERIKPGMTANAVIEASKIEGVLVVPLRAVFENGGKSFVKINANGVVTDREIIIGLRDSKGNAEAVSGLKEGDMIVISEAK